MAYPHHDAAAHDERRRRKAKLLRTEQRCDDDVATGLELAICLNHDPVAQPVDHEGLLSFSQPKFPRGAGVLE